MYCINTNTRSRASKKNGGIFETNIMRELFRSVAYWIATGFLHNRIEHLTAGLLINREGGQTKLYMKYPSKEKAYHVNHLGHGFWAGGLSSRSLL